MRVENIEARFIVAARTHVARDKDVREYLKGACLSWRNGHVILTATDSHTLIACRVAEGVDQFAPVILPSDLLKKIGANKGPVTCEINVTDSATHIVLEQGYATYRGLALDGCYYPNWVCLVPSECSGENAQFNGALLGRMHESFCALHSIKRDQTERHPHLYHNGSNPAVVDMEDEDVVAIIAPRHVPTAQPEQPAIPAWLGK